jgi:hemolysin activation/secretion protein
MGRKTGEAEWTRRITFLCFFFLAALYSQTLAQAQTPLHLDPTGRSGDAPKLLPEDRPAPPPTAILPPVSSLLTPKATQFPTVRVFVREIKVPGSTVFSATELAAVAAPYTNREATTEDLEELRLALTRLYVERGYINSGAVIPDQTVANGIITFQIIEGALSRVELEGNDWFRAGYLENRLTLDTGRPLNLNVLQQRLQLLQQNARIRRLNAELRPGIKLGESTLRVRVQEERPYSLLIGFNNYQSPTVGAERGLITLAHQNLTGNGDVLNVTYGRSAGIDPQLDTSYAFPITARDTTVSVRYRKNDFIVVEDPFAPLDVESESEIFGVTLRQPVYHTLHHEFAVSLVGERIYNKTFLRGEPFSFSLGARNGKSTVSALRLALEWTERTSTQVLAAQSRFSIGIDALGATNNGGGRADGQFFTWLGQFQWVRRLPWWDIHTIARMDLQLTTDPLLPVEQIAVGGRYSVRGYRENQLVRDNGFVASLESRIPIFHDTPWAETIQLAPFFDIGQAWNKDTPSPGRQTITSLGIGLRWAWSWTYVFQYRPELEVYWGHSLMNIETSGGDLQDSGVHMQFTVAVF